VEHKLTRRVGGVVLLVIVAVIAVFLQLDNGGITPSVPPHATETDDTLDFTPAGNQAENSIVIPGMTGINMVAGQLQQSVDFYNPESNKCYFVLSLYLSNNTRIYQSHYLAPGERITDITLTQILQRGVYGKCRLVYECYTLTDKRPLNGGQVQLEINAT